MEMAGVEKTWAGRVRLGMKVVMIGLIVEDDVVVETSLIFTQALPLMSPCSGSIHVLARA